MENQIKELIDNYKKKLTEINAGIPQFKGLNLTYKVALQEGKRDILVNVIKDLSKLIESK